MKKSLPVFILLLAWVVFILLHMSAVSSNLYWYIWWLDILMHTWGGFLVVTSWYQIKRVGAFPVLMCAWWFQPLLILLLVMIVWELFEFKFGLISEYQYVIDTTYDFLNGFGGGLVAFLLFRSRTINK